MCIRLLTITSKTSIVVFLLLSKKISKNVEANSTYLMANIALFLAFRALCRYIVCICAYERYTNGLLPSRYVIIKRVWAFTREWILILVVMFQTRFIDPHERYLWLNKNSIHQLQNLRKELNWFIVCCHILYLYLFAYMRS